MKQRMLIIALIFSLSCALVLTRLATLQWFPNHHTKTALGQLSYARNWRYQAIQQRQHSLSLQNGRALFKDINGQLIHKQVKTYMLLTPYIKHDHRLQQVIDDIALTLNLNRAAIANQISQMKEPTWLKDEQGNPISLNVNKAQKLKQNETFGLYFYDTFENIDEGAFIHAIGFTAENPERLYEDYSKKLNQINNWHIDTQFGVMGLERSLDRYLHGVEQEQLAWYVDVNGRMLEGLGLHHIGNYQFYPLQVQTTLNLEQQEAIDAIVQQHKANQIAVVLVDVATNDIQAIVSKPSLFPRKLNEEMMKNLAVSSHRPGSIYKLFTLAAALEFGVVERDEQFICNGEYGKYGLSCWKPGGHGKQTLLEAFANSCNVTFAQLSERLTATQLEQVTHALGGIHAIGWNEQTKHNRLTMFIEEENGRFFVDSSTSDRGEIAQAVMGQRDTLINPLQAASVVAAIARGGQVYEARLATNITFKDGHLLQKFEPHKLTTSRYKLKASTLTFLQQAMEQVVTEGTGMQLQALPVKVAGKSGTAQLSDTSTSRNNYWFVGYFPVHQPKYALAVVVLNEKQSHNPATQLFGDIVKELYK